MVRSDKQLAIERETKISSKNGSSNNNKNDSKPNSNPLKSPVIEEDVTIPLLINNGSNSSNHNSIPTIVIDNPTKNDSTNL